MLKQLSFNVFLKQAVPSITFVELNDNYLLAWFRVKSPFNVINTLFWVILFYFLTNKFEMFDFEISVCVIFTGKELVL